VLGHPDSSVAGILALSRCPCILVAPFSVVSYFPFGMITATTFSFFSTSTLRLGLSGFNNCSSRNSAQSAANSKPPNSCADSANIVFNKVFRASNKDFYLTSIFVSLTKTALNDSAAMGITMSNEEGVTVYFYIPLMALTLQTEMFTLPFPHPVKLKRGSNISCFGAYTAGTAYRSVLITGFVME